jgi:hypothetical protein
MLIIAGVIILTLPIVERVPFVSTDINMIT